MNCPNCNGQTRVTMSLAGASVVIRRRECQACKYVFITEEYARDDEVSHDPEEPRKIGY